LEVPPGAAKAFVKDMQNFTPQAGFEKDEIAARQLHALSRDRNSAVNRGRSA
jgi:hypothetical protein